MQGADTSRGANSSYKSLGQLDTWRAGDGAQEGSLDRGPMKGWICTPEAVCTSQMRHRGFQLMLTLTPKASGRARVFWGPHENPNPGLTWDTDSCGSSFLSKSYSWAFSTSFQPWLLIFLLLSPSCRLLLSPKIAYPAVLCPYPLKRLMKQALPSSYPTEFCQLTSSCITKTISKGLSNLG